MKVKRIEHVGIVVRDVEASRKLWEGCFGIKLGGTEDNATRRLALYPVGDSMVELQVLLGQVVDSYERIETLKEGDLLFFKKPELATVYIGGLPAFDCQVGMAGPNVAIRIEKSLNPETI